MSNQRSGPVRLGEIRPGERLQVLSVGGEVVVAELLLALRPLARFRGLLGRPEPGELEGLLLRPCSGVHTFFMGYPIDVAFLDEAGRVVAICEALPPWRASPYLGGRACAALELRAGRLRRAGVQEGEPLRFLPWSR